MAKYKKYYAYRQRNCAENGMTIYRIPRSNEYLLEQNPFSKRRNALKEWDKGLFWGIKGYPKKNKYGKWNYSGSKWKRISGNWFKEW